MKIDKKVFPWVVLSVFLIFQQAILNYTTGFFHNIITNADEFFEIIFLLIILLKAKSTKKELTKYEFAMCACFGSMILLGIISSFVKSIQPIQATIKDIIVCCRFIIYYLTGRLLISKGKEVKFLLTLEKPIKVVTVINVLLAVHEILLTPFFPKSEYRYFMEAIQLYFPHPTYFAVACFSCIVVLISCMEFSNNSKKINLIYIIANCFLMIITLRSKAIASAICVLLLYLIIIKFKVKSKLFIGIIVGFIGLCFGYGQIETYYLQDNASEIVRARLHLDSVTIANRFFPLGSGFGTFGSNVAAGPQYYSPLYVKLGYNNLYGGSKKFNAFLSDTFWPIVIAQFGWIGLVLFLGVIYFLFKLILLIKQKKYFYLYWDALSIMLYTLISSTSEPAFFNPSFAILFFILGIIVRLSVNNQTVLSVNSVLGGGKFL